MEARRSHFFTALLLGSTVVLRSAPTSAQCMTDAEKSTFSQLLRTRLANSQLAVTDLYRHAQDRLSYGPNPRQAGAIPPTGTKDQQIDALTQAIANSLGTAARIRTELDTALANLPREIIPKNADGSVVYPELSAKVFRHAATGMTEAYTESYKISEYIKLLVEANENLPPGPWKDLLEAEIQRQRNLANYTVTEFTHTATVRMSAHALQATPIDVGAVFTEFWSNHFNSDANVSRWAAVDYRKTIQRSMCGTFRALLTQVAKHPAMLVYLHLYRNRAGATNQNYARELMELHTFGDDRYRYYDQNDVQDVARILTGWSIAYEKLESGNVRPHFEFFGGAHDGAAITLFDTAPSGQPLTIAAGSGPTAVTRGEQLLAYLARHPATKTNICTKLSQWILGTAPTAIVQGCAAAAVWGEDGNLPAIYRYFLTTRELWTSTVDLPESQVASVPRLYGAMQKTPFELVVSAERAVGQPLTGTLTERRLKTLVAQIGIFGLRLGTVSPPTGYPVGNVWLSSGMVIGLQRYLFTQLPTTHLQQVVGGQTLTDAALEAHYQARVVAAGSNSTTLGEIANAISTDVLRMPGAIALSSNAKIGGLLDADTAISGGARAPVRSIVHAIGGNSRFIRK